MWMVSLAYAQAGKFVEEDVTTLWSSSGGPGGAYGWAVADVPDTDGDGVTDALLGAPQSTGTGATVLLSGADGHELWRHPGANRSAEGYAVAAAGDLDGDGVWDVISGAPSADRVVVLSGVDGAELFVLSGVEGESFGAAVGRAGDVDGDGVEDLVVGAEGADEARGRVGVWSGRTHALLWSVPGAAAGDRMGSGTGFLGDVTGDGVPDVAVGGWGNGGRVWVLDGRDGTRIREHVDPEGGGVLGQFFVSGVGDLDGDGVPEVYGGDYANPAEGQGTGRAFVWSGATGAVVHVFTGSAAGEGLGPGRYAGDVDGDGVGDLSIGSWQYGGGAAGAGRVTLFSGADGAVLRTITSTREGENLGFDAVGLGDVDGDGRLDLLVSAATASRVYLVAGVLGGASEDTAPPVVGDEEGAGCGCRPVGGDCAWPLLPLGAMWLRRRSAVAPVVVP